MVGERKTYEKNDNVSLQTEHKKEKCCFLIIKTNKF